MTDSEIILIKDDCMHIMTIGVKNSKVEEQTKVDLTKFNKCMMDLKLSDIQQVKFCFAQVCDWFIKDSQYVKFEEIK